MSWIAPKGIITAHGTIILSKGGKESVALFCPKTGFRCACNISTCPLAYWDQRYLHLCDGIELPLTCLTDLRHVRDKDDVVDTRKG